MDADELLRAERGGFDAVDPGSCLPAGDGVRWDQQACCRDPEVKRVGHSDVDVHALEDLADLTVCEQPCELAGTCRLVNGRPAK